MTTKRDYRLAGPENRRAVEQGLADGQWWRPPIGEARLLELMQRTNSRAARDTVLWLGLIVALAIAAVITWWSWWSLAILFAYGVVYGGASDSRWHECGHGTAFRSRWANDVIYLIASFMLWREPTMWRWSHYRHHTDTIIVGRDAEIVFQRPPKLRSLPLAYLHIINGPKMLWRMAQHAVGFIDDEANDFVPESEHRRLMWENRVFLTIIGVAVASSVVWANPLPVLLVGLPTIYGGWVVVFFGITQHAGLREDVLDHRRNSRTVYMNPVFRFLYSNMNYHIEHHIFPGVPYHALPALHEEIKAYLPPASPNTISAYRELLGALRHQQTDPTWEIPDRAIPEVPSSQAAFIDVGPIVEQPPPGEHDSEIGGHHATDLGPIEDMDIGQVRRVDVGGQTYAVYRMTSTEVAVTDGYCTHGKAHLSEGLVLDCMIECPRHNGRFDLRTGAPIRKPAVKPISVHETAVVCGRIKVVLPPTGEAT